MINCENRHLHTLTTIKQSVLKFPIFVISV